MMITCPYSLSKLIECTPTMNPNIMIMTCQCRFTDFNKYTTMVRDVDNGERYACVGASAYGKSLYFHFCCEKKSNPLKKMITIFSGQQNHSTGCDQEFLCWLVGGV